MSDKELAEHVRGAIGSFKGQVPELESAIGALYVGREFGWRVMYLMHDKKTIRKYEKILGLAFRDVMEEEGPLAEKSIAWRAMKHVTNFWKAVRGEIPNVKSPEITK